MWNLKRKVPAIFYGGVPRTADCCVISYLNSGLNNTVGGHGAFHSPSTSYCAKVSIEHFVVLWISIKRLVPTDHVPLL